MSCCSRPERVGRDGYLRLVFERRGQRTVLTERRFTLPLQALEPSQLADGSLYLMLLNPTGGVVGGDRLRTRIVLGAGSHVILTTPSAGKVYRARDEAAHCETEITLGEDAILEYLPDHLIPHPGAALRQKLSVEMGTGGCAILYDGMAAGRIGHGERWRFREITSEIALNFDASIQFLARSSLLPASYPLASSGLMDGYHYLGSIIAFRHSVVPTAEDVAALNEAICATPGVWGGASISAGNGMIAKFLAANAVGLSAAMLSGWSVLRKRLLGAPGFDLRKL